MPHFAYITDGKLVNTDQIRDVQIFHPETDGGKKVRMAINYIDGKHEDVDFTNDLLQQITNYPSEILPAPSGYRVYFLEDFKIVDPAGWDVLAFAYYAFATDGPLTPICALGFPIVHQPWCFTKFGSGKFFDRDGGIYRSLDEWIEDYKTDTGHKEIV